ncbi:hypothetical protein [Litoreibacter janthinus]|uniref:Uncharacterized protein n=1 Tax=Litoreibacter janthinus TaxID=670154 RepID=A0A1I6G9Q7_9RHOB|nr:hypothetical protein [Litoreibacter janthinus]SFR38942.1 hypothetical protein SAMN04488002_1116 [Litoreibacter janthinus]
MPDLFDISSEPNDADLLWQLTGARAGPILLVTGSARVVLPVVDRLRVLPSLVYLRGTLCVGGRDYVGQADEQLSLDGVAADDIYWGILSRAAELGMISGRGIPLDRPWTQAPIHNFSKAS